MNPLKKLASETALYGLSSIVGRAVNFLLVPFYTSIFAASAYGVVTELYAYVAFFNVLYTYGMETAYFRFATRTPAERADTYRGVFTLVLATSVVLTLTLVLLADPIATALRYPGRGAFVAMLAVTMGVDAVAAMAFARLRLEGKARKFALVRLTNIFLNIGLNLFFLVGCARAATGAFGPLAARYLGPLYDADFGVGYVFLSNLLANACFVLLLRREMFGPLRWPRERLRAMWQYAYPLLFMGLAGVTSEMLGRSFLKYLLPEDFYDGYGAQTALGIYGACYKLSVFISLSVQAFRYAAEPFFFSRAADKTSPDLFARVMTWFVIVNGFSFLAIGLNTDWLGALLLRRDIYQQGLFVVPYLLMAYILLGIYYNLSVWFKLTDQTYFGTYLSLGGAALTVAGNVLLIPQLGYWGSALTTLITYGLMAAACYRIGQRHYPIPYRLDKILGYLALAVGLLAVGNWLTPAALVGKLLARAALLGLYLLAVAVSENLLKLRRA